MIHYISPYSIEKNIGGAINDAIKQIGPDPNDWIVHTDHDTMFLLPDSKKQMEEIMGKTKLDVLGPLTNRLGIPYQLFEGAMNIFDARIHIGIAKGISDRDYGMVTHTYHTLAAFCLCFRAEVWERLGGFDENTLDFDKMFCSKARNRGFRTGLMTGVYVFHLYRMGKDVKDHSHLVKK